MSKTELKIEIKTFSINKRPYLYIIRANNRPLSL
jgi:hypothetical protein